RARGSRSSVRRDPPAVARVRVPDAGYQSGQGAGAPALRGLDVRPGGEGALPGLAVRGDIPLRRALWLGVPLATLALLRVVPATPLLRETSFSRVVADRHGRLLRLTLSQDEKFRRYTKLSNVAPVAVQATLLHEDQHFFWHPGVDPLRLAKAALATVTGRGRRQGGSTITMQLARRLYRLDTRSVPGKLRQMALAAWIEARHSKAEILEAYLNLAPYGGNIEGLGAAAELLFGVSADRLGLNQALTLALLPQSPSARVVPGQSP